MYETPIGGFVYGVISVKKFVKAGGGFNAEKW